MRILLATDGSWSSDRACDLVAAMPVPNGTRVRVLSVAPYRESLLEALAATAAATAEADAVDEDIRHYRTAIDTAAEAIQIARPGVEVDTLLLQGRIASSIVTEAREFKADLVVVGNRGHGPWETVLLGSVSAEVVDHAHCPVLVARGGRLGPIVFANDGSKSARAAEALLGEIPIFKGEAMTVLSVVEADAPYSAATADAHTADGSERGKVRAEAEGTAARLAAKGCTIKTLIRDGNPGHEIVEFAREGNAGLIVVGTRGHAGFARLVLGSVARNVLLNAHCSVLVVRRRRARDVVKRA